MATPPLSLRALRTATIAATLVIGLGAFMVFIQIGSVDGLDMLDLVRACLILISTTWLAWGGIQGLLGLTTSPATRELDRSKPITAKTIVIMPVYNEDPRVSFSRLAAMDRSLKQTSIEADVHFVILSDTRDETIAAQEEQLFVHLVEETDGMGRFFYRRREENTGKKAGNLEDFIVRSGRAYDYAVILDADSLMEGKTIIEMIRRMDADPSLGLLQTLPKIVRARSRFGRAMQFSASFFSPIFCRGQAMLQGRTGPFWGHNAIVRVSAFAQSCGLPVLRGAPPFGGHILSHDYVEAALLARAGWTVRVDDDLGGSFEEGPENIVEHAKRDRRWCQGNLQHGRILNAPDLKAWSRFTFAQGIMAYVAPVFWLAFLIASVLDPYFDSQPDYFPEPNWPIPYIPPSMATEAIGLFVGIFGLLFLPKLLMVIKAGINGQARLFGGFVRVLGSTLWELLFSSMIAPIMMLFATRSVYQVLMGKDGGWPSSDRGDGRLGLLESLAASWWIALSGIGGLVMVEVFAPDLLFWLMPVALPLALAPLILWWSSRSDDGTLLTVPGETKTPAIVLLHDAILESWQPRSLDSPLTPEASKGSKAS
ncbi:membrane glycosyltransferase [Cohaesibacter sp. ES.047]|uniref:glucans biosynthesis glucosyltransferase MdoH n=1 Tax=Cohaesibacter sp. ES.047 TaxID=1798205 RepID=UPI000BB80B4B|nr:glucans biosynthesis glucosyltransferase MdoH [Cohaesibacter sp. ES.047]SNY90839.1 membrane glycosyltransferase [Cohaesibacter sp. ES.047]